jgi:hypothetical protein
LHRNLLIYLLMSATIVDRKGANVSKLVVNGAQLQCDQGLAPSSLNVLPVNGTVGDEKPVATVNDFAPMVNIAPFGMCRAMANPQVATATAAAQGVLTPQPCIPVTTGPWTPGSSIVTINGQAALTSDSRCMCSWTGNITITSPGNDFDVEG